MAQTSLQLDPGTLKAIDELKDVFGVTTTTAVVRKAIGLARIAARTGDPSDHTVTMLDQSGEQIKVSLVG